MADTQWLAEEPPQRHFKTGNGLLVTLYLYGDELDPDTVSAAVGVAADRSRRKGPYQGSTTGRTYLQRHGFWSIDSGIESDDLHEHLKAILDRLPDPGMNLMSLPQVTSGRFDVLVQHPNAGSDTSPHIGFLLEAHEVEALARLGVCFELTFYLDDWYCED
ncbi:MAG TPA: DUF4279 domain-containing protein [Tahibacter sp.]|nr:DUF4279 domain-containing protein [Tahibacter sp.]